LLGDFIESIESENVFKQEILNESLHEVTSSHNTVSRLVFLKRIRELEHNNAIQLNRWCEANSSNFTLSTEAEWTYETLVPYQNTTWRHNSEDPEDISSMDI
jgi:hypothetical protein